MEEQSTNDCGSEVHMETIRTAKKLLRQDAWHRGILSFNVCPLVLVLGSIIKKSSNLRSINDLTILKHSTSQYEVVSTTKQPDRMQLVADYKASHADQRVFSLVLTC